MKYAQVSQVSADPELLTAITLETMLNGYMTWVTSICNRYISTHTQTTGTRTHTALVPRGQWATRTINQQPSTNNCHTGGVQKLSYHKQTAHLEQIEIPSVI